MGNSIGERNERACGVRGGDLIKLFGCDKNGHGLFFVGGRGSRAPTLLIRFFPTPLRCVPE